MSHVRLHTSMCGITVCITPSSQDATSCHCSEWDELVSQNAARGPDSQSQAREVASGTSLQFVASTLHLRGEFPVAQPHISEKNIFCWNGEVFEGLDIPTEINDGSALFSALEAAEDFEEICMVTSRVEGPYAFVLYQRKKNKLFFARDPLGRRSLLICRPHSSNSSLILSSVFPCFGGGRDVEEVDPRYVYCLDVKRLWDAEMNDWAFDKSLSTLERNVYGSFASFGTFTRVNTELPDAPRPINISSPLPDFVTSVIQRFIDVLDRSVRLRVQNIPKPKPNDTAASVAVLYSGGIDSTMIAHLASRHIPLNEPIDLLNVAFENPRKIQNRHAWNQLKGKHKHRTASQQTVVSDDEIYRVPDRITGLEQLKELRKLCPGRQWNFVEVDVEYTESSSARELVKKLMFPSRTVMDLSLALALYFASRGVGKLRKDGPAEYYSSSARVLLNGLGSDELLGGYGRHRSAFNTGGWQALIEELQLELDRLPSRNLGRDDRVTSAHGKETRHPFLSLSVVNFLASLPVHLKVDPRLEIGVGDKMLLRLAARSLGLELASKRRKRAMQFGSHSARMEGGEEDRSGDIFVA